MTPGQNVSVPVLEAARQKVQGLDIFSTVSFQFKFESGNPTKYDVLYTVAEDNQVLPMHFERLGAEHDAYEPARDASARACDRSAHCVAKRVLTRKLSSRG